MNTVDGYLELAERPNTRRSYASAVRHFELEWRGLLPATPDAIAEYLAAYAPTQAVSTLRARLAGLARWHLDHGFQDPTKSPVVRRVLKGIRTAHNASPRQARPIELELLEQVSDKLEADLAQTTEDDVHERAARIRLLRDHAMLLLGFWRGFRSDELTRLQFEDVRVEPDVRLVCFIPRSKADRQSVGQQFECPALSRLCPVAAFIRWKAASGLTSGPVFRAIDQWGNVSERGLAPKTIGPWLRQLFAAAGVEDPSTYSSHSLRRGFANWARASGWDLKELMQYVGWRDVQSALRYLDNDRQTLATRFERSLEASGRRKGQTSKPASSAADSRDDRRRQGAKVLHPPVRSKRK